MRFFSHPPQLVKNHLSTMPACLMRVVTISIALACMLWLSVRVYGAGADATVEPGPENLDLGLELTLWTGAAEGNGILGVGDMKINIEAYNKKREKDIADASRKLLSLAIALKTDLERSPDAAPSPNAVRTAREIEKLAHDVKENMKLNIIGPQ